MKTNRIMALALFLALLGSTACAAAEKSNPNTVTITVIELKGNPNGSQDQGLNEGLKRYITDGKDNVEVKVVTVDRKKALKDSKYKGLNLDYMPLYLVDKNAITEEKFGDAIKNGQLRTSGNFIVFEKQTGNGIDLNKKAVPNQLEIFVMSQCPYGVLAENKIIEAIKQGKMPKNVKVNIRYIVNAGYGDNFSSLHGSGEWEEDVRQLIVKKYAPEKFWTYLEIRNKDYHSSLWDDAAEKAGLDPKMFKEHWKEGLDMLREEAKYTEENGVNGSPTVIWEGRVRTNMNDLAKLPGFAGLNEVRDSNGNAAPQQPSGSC